MKNECGKGDSRRPTLISKSEENVAWERALPGSTMLYTWYLCPRCNRRGMNYRNPCPDCGPEKKEE